MSVLFSILLLTARVAWSPTYTYILLFFAAAAFVAFIARPRDRGEAVKKLFAGEIIPAGDDHTAIDNKFSGPRVHVLCREGGNVIFERLDVPGLTLSGALSLAVTFKGKDIEILERLSPGYISDKPAAGASFVIDMTGHEWRHVKWMDEESGLWCAFTLHVRPGIEFTVPLRR